MPNTISVEEAEHDLRRILASLSEGERLTVVDETGTPLGEVTTVSQEKSPPQDHREAFMDRWSELTEKIGDAWDGEKSAVDQLREDRSRLDPNIQHRTKDQ